MNSTAAGSLFNLTGNCVQNALINSIVMGICIQGICESDYAEPESGYWEGGLINDVFWLAVYKLQNKASWFCTQRVMA